MRSYQKKISAISLSALLMFSCTACAQETNAETPAPQVAVICKSTDPYWDAVKLAVQDAASEREISVSYTAPEKEDYQKQAELIQQAVNDGVQVVVLAPVVMDELNDTLSEVIQKGIPVLTIDSDVSLPERTAFIGTQNEKAAVSAGERTKILAHKGDVVAVLTHDSTSQTAQQRTSGFQSQFTSDDIQLLEPVDCGGDVSQTKEITVRMINENPDIDFIYTTNQPTTMGACQAVENMIQAGSLSEGEVQIIGFDYFEGAEAYLDNNILSGIVVQNPYNMGYFGVMAASYLLNHEQIPASIMDTGTEFVTKYNINDQNIQFMIHPSR
ncbi:MAG: substrate-binding domain-containing protein [Oscillospiraceae bacterium]|nr:substrate-binding domain-containing protein [Oscillospiraceae bacterium]